MNGILEYCYNGLLLSVTCEFPSQRPVTLSFDVFFLSAPWISDWVNNRGAGDLGRHRAHYDVIVVDIDDVLDMNGSQEEFCLQKRIKGLIM